MVNKENLKQTQLYICSINNMSKFHFHRPNAKLSCFKKSMYGTGRSLVRSQLVSLEFFIDIKYFRSHYGPGIDSASNRNEYQEHFLGVKAAGA